jgi:hypothetical protein
MWDRPLFTAAEKFLDALPIESRQADAIQALAFVRSAHSTDVIREVLKNLTNINDQESIFICGRVHLYYCDNLNVAIKALPHSEKWPALRAEATSIFQRVQELRRYSSADVSMRFQAVSVALEQC